MLVSPVEDVVETEPRTDVVPARSRPISSLRTEAAALFRLGAPLIGAQLAQISMHLVDTVMAGQLGSASLAAIAVGGNVWMPIFCIGLGVIMSVTPTVAHLFGADRRGDIGEVVRQGLWLSLFLSGCAFGVARLVPQALQWFEVAPSLIPTASQYVAAMVWGFPALMGWNVLRAYCEGVGRTQPIMWVSLASLPFHIVSNYVLMHGAYGFPRLGAVGCGYASAASMWIMLLAMTTWVVVDRRYREFAFLDRFSGPHPKLLLELVTVGLPIGFSIFMEGGMFCAVGLMMGKLGQVTAAANQVALSVASVTFMVPLGLAMAVTIRVGQAIGRGEPTAARLAGATGNLLCLCFMACMAVLIACFPQEIASLYTTDVAVIALTQELLILAAIFQVFDGLQVSGAGALRGLKDTRVPMAITFIAYWLVGLPLAYGLGLVGNLGPVGLWTGLILGLLVAATLLNLRFYRRVGQFIRQRAFADETNDLGDTP